MERVQAEENRAAVNGAGNHHEAAAPDAGAGPLPWRWRRGYTLVATPVMAVCAGLVDGPWAAFVAYALLLHGVASISRAMLPPGPIERVRAEGGRAAVGDADSHREVAFPDAALAWCGYALVAAPVMGVSAGLSDTPGAALLAYALLLLGFAFISLAMLPPRPMQRMLEENRAVGNTNRQGGEAVVIPSARTMDWTGYLFVAAPVLASWAGLVDGPGATLFAYALLLLGVFFIVIAMLALAKPKLA